MAPSPLRSVAIFMKYIDPLSLIFRTLSPLLAVAALSTTMACATPATTPTGEANPLQLAGQIQALPHDAVIDSVLGARSSLNPKDGSFYQAFSLDAKAGDVFSITARSSDFDAYLSVFTEEGNLLAANDDYGSSSTDARVISRLPQDGRYWIVVSALETATQGRFSLEVTPLSTATTVNFPGTTSAWLFASGLRHPEMNSDVVSFDLNVETEQMVQVQTSTDSFPPTVTIFDPATNKIVAMNRSGQGTTSAVLEPGSYEILVGSQHSGLFGSFDLTVNYLDVNLPDGVVIGEKIMGLLSQGGVTFAPRDVPARPYTLTITERSGVDIHLESDEFDAFLTLTNDAGEILAENDDFSGTTNARLFLNLEPGTYTIWAQAFEGDQGGFFSLGVNLFATTESQDITINSSFDGILDALADVHPERGSRFLTYTLDLEETQRLQFDLTSDDFDSYLILTDASGTVIEENDDRDDGTLHSRINRELEPGRYHILVMGLDRDNFGRFKLEVK